LLVRLAAAADVATTAILMLVYCFYDSAVPH
jgi:hypothetical protein